MLLFYLFHLFKTNKFKFRHVHSIINLYNCAKNENSHRELKCLCKYNFTSVHKNKDVQLLITYFFFYSCVINKSPVQTPTLFMHLSGSG